MNRRDFIKKSITWSTGAFLTGSFAGCALAKNHPQKLQKNIGQPNFLILFSDDQGYGDLSLHGNKYLETPNIDSLAKESVQFKNFFVHACCAPSRAALLTGRNPHEVGVWGVHMGRPYINLDEKLFSDVLQESGYKTFMAGKWHSGMQTPWAPWNRGFDDAYVGGYNQKTSRVSYNGSKPKPFEGEWQRDYLINKCVDFLKKNKNNRFCAYMPFFTPHTPWVAPDRLIDKYKKKGCSEKLALFNAYMEHLDEGIGTLLNSLKNLGLDENTVVIYMSDNGPTHGKNKDEDDWELRNPQNFRGEKGDIWDLGIRSPLFIRYPAKYKPAVVEQNVCIEDIYPTLLDMANIKTPENKILNGKSIVPLLADPSVNWKDRYIVREHFDPHWTGKEEQHDLLTDFSAIKYEDQSLSIRNQRFKLCKIGRAFDHSDRNYEKHEGYKRGSEYQLYDITKDPEESVNVINKYPAIAEKMKKAMKDWYAPVMANPENYFTKPFLPIGYPGDKEAQISFSCCVSAKGSVKRGPFNSLPQWTKKGDSVTIQADVVQTGTYKVLIHCISLEQGAEFDLAVGDTKIRKKFTGKTSSFNDFGEIKLNKKGKTLVKFTLVNELPNKSAMKKPFYISFEKKNEKNY